MSASDLAERLASMFMKDGLYDKKLFGDGVRFPDQPAPANTALAGEYFDTTKAVAGLQVQSVAYTKGARTESVVIYVTKGSKRALSALPASLDGVPVLARVFGRPRTILPAASPFSAANSFRRNNRVACGSSCTPSGQTYAGTLGALIRINNEIYALSNNHVFASCNHIPVGMQVLSPAPGDAKAGGPPITPICEFSKMVELRSGIPSQVPTMSVDCAIGLVRNRDVVSSWQGDGTGSYDTPSTVGSFVANKRVKKWGRTTGFTSGIVEAYHNTPWVMPYRSSNFTAHVWFKNTWTVRTDDGTAFALPGDSGSLVVSEDGHEALGLVFGATGSEYAICCELSAVFLEIGAQFSPPQPATLVHGHGI